MVQKWFPNLWMVERQTTTGWGLWRADSLPQAVFARRGCQKRFLDGLKKMAVPRRERRAFGINLPTVGYRELPQVTVRFRGWPDSARELLDRRTTGYWTTGPLDREVTEPEQGGPPMDKPAGR